MLGDGLTEKALDGSLGVFGLVPEESVEGLGYVKSVHLLFVGEAFVRLGLPHGLVCVQRALCRLYVEYLLNEPFGVFEVLVPAFLVPLVEGECHLVSDGDVPVFEGVAVVDVWDARVEFVPNPLGLARDVGAVDLGCDGIRATGAFVFLQ